MNDDRFMNYGPDWPPVPARLRRRRSLLRRCANTVATYAIIALAGLLALHIRQAYGPTYRLDGGPHTIPATAPAHP